MHINDLLKTAVASGASDLHVKVGSYPVMRVNGLLVVASEEKRLDRGDTEAMAGAIMGAEHVEKFRKFQEVDLAYSVAGLGRFRANVFQQRGTVGIVLRVIPFGIRSIDDLGLPPVLKQIAQEERGLILVTGTTGSGKSTTLAAMIDHVNATRSAHIMTIEDPIEYLHRDYQSIVNQREVSVDTTSFAKALRSALRQDPDVILVGEMRDYETVETALNAAETGHLVFATLHTNSAAEAINRIIDVFPSHQQSQVRAQLAFVLGALANRLRLSPLVGYLLAGVLAGPFTPGFVGDQTLAPQLAEIGVILLMFGVGLHFSLRDLMAVRRIAIPGAIAQITVATVLGWGMARWLGWPTLQGVIFGFSLATASTVVLLRAMEERRLLDTTRGRIAVGWLIVEDLACVLALVLIPALAGLFGEGEGNTGSVWWALALTFGKLVAFVAFMLVVGRRVIPWILERIAGTGSRELFTLAVLAIAMGVAFGSAELFGVSFALGAFFAGMLLNESEFSHQAAQDSLPMRDAFAVLFFVSVGMLFDPHILVEHPLQVLATTLIIVFGKSAAAFVIVRAFGHPTATALTISTSLAQIGEFSFILASLGVGLKLLPVEARDLVLAGALLSIVVNPMLFVALTRWQSRQTDASAPNIATKREPLPGPALPVGEHTILVGYGRVGHQLATLLRERGVPLVVIDSDRELVARAHHDGIAAVRGNAASAALLDELLPATATHALIAIPNAFEAGEIIARLRKANAAMTILARAHSEAEARHLFDHGADGAVLAERELAFSMAEMVLADPRLAKTALL